MAPPLDEDEECFPRPPRPSLSPLLRPMRFIFDFSAQTWRFLCVVEGHGNQSEGFPHLVSKVKATNPPRSLPLYCRAEQRAPERCEGGLAEMGSQPLRVAKKVALGFPLLHRVPAGQGVGWRSLAPSTSLPPGLAPELAVPLSSASLSSDLKSPESAFCTSLAAVRRRLRYRADSVEEREELNSDKKVLHSRKNGEGAAAAAAVA